MARLRFGEPLNLAPNVSVNSARRRHAKSSAVAALIRRSASTRRGVATEWVLCASREMAIAVAQASATRWDDESRMWVYFNAGAAFARSRHTEAQRHRGRFPVQWRSRLNRADAATRRYSGDHCRPLAGNRTLCIILRVPVSPW